MFYIYFFIFFTNKCTNLYRQTHFMNDNMYNDKMNILTVQNNTDINVYNYSLKSNETYVVKDGFDTRYHISYNESEILNFIYNKKKLYIYYLLLSNSISIPDKLNLVDSLDDFSTKSKYTPSLFSGGFFKDSDFLF